MTSHQPSDCCASLNTRRKSAALRAKATSAIEHPDHTEHLKRLNRVIGQLVAVKRMIEDRQYCPDILTQTRAAASALKAMELAILKTHLQHCVADALNAPDKKQAARKIDELVAMLNRF